MLFFLLLFNSIGSFSIIFYSLEALNYVPFVDGGTIHSLARDIIVVSSINWLINTQFSIYTRRTNTLLHRPQTVAHTQTMKM